MMIELLPQIYTNTEIAEWAGISEKYFTKNRKAWCEKHLSKKAKYKLLRDKKVEILEVYDPYYNHSTRKQIIENFDKCWGNGKDKIDTCKDASRKLRAIIITDVKDTTFYSYVCSAKRELYGVSKKRPGKRGQCKYILCLIKNGEYYSFTPEEEEIKKEIFKKYYQKINEESATERLGLKKSFKNNEITKEEYYQLLADCVDAEEIQWDIIMAELEEAIGYPVVIATLLEDNAILIYQLKKDKKD